MSVVLTDQDAQPKRDYLAAVSPWAETLSKAVAGVVIAVYASGFLAVSLYDSQFGFVGTNPLRPRVLAAGAWFFFFTSIPVSVAAGFRKHPWRWIAKNAPSIWLACISLAALTTNFLFEAMPISLRKATIHLPLWAWIFPSVLWLILVAVINRSTPPRWLPDWLAIGLSVILTIFFVTGPLLTLVKQHQFDASSLAVWFFGVTLIVLIEFKIQNLDNLTTFGNWAKPMAVFFGFLLAFSQYLYPHLKASWGGGTPVNVTVYFSRDAPLYPNKSVQAQLVEEADDGFYIAGLQESKAIYVPRAAVSMIYFADKPSDSALLQGSK